MTGRGRDPLWADSTPTPSYYGYGPDRFPKIPLNFFQEVVSLRWLVRVL